MPTSILPNKKPNLNPLALPRGQKRHCDLCGASRSFYSCTTCKQVFYCTAEHRDTDYRITHKFLCEHYHFLRTCPRPVQPRATRERFLQQIRLTKERIVQICMDLAHTSLREGRSGEAIPQVLAAIKLERNLQGAHSPLMVTAFCLLAEASIKEKRSADAHSAIVKARHLMGEHHEVLEPATKALFYRTEGCYFMSIDDTDEALYSYAKEVYLATEAYHTESRVTAYGYFHLGQVFYRLDNKIVAYSHYMHTVDIWFKYLRGVFVEETTPNKKRKKGFEFQKKSVISNSDMTVGKDILSCIKADTVDAGWSGTTMDEAKICLALSMCFYLNSNGVADLEQALFLSDLISFQVIEAHGMRSSVAELRRDTPTYLRGMHVPSSRRSSVSSQHRRSTRRRSTLVQEEVLKGLKMTASFDDKTEIWKTELQGLAHSIRTNVTRRLDLVRKNPLTPRTSLKVSQMEEEIRATELSTGRLSLAYSGNLILNIMQNRKWSSSGLSHQDEEHEVGTNISTCTIDEEEISSSSGSSDEDEDDDV